jgi:hypothetical protein
LAATRLTLPRHNVKKGKRRKPKSRPEAAFGGSCKPFYFIAPEAAFIAPVADDAASIAEVAADEAEDIALDAASVADGVGAAIVAGGGVVVVVVVSSFLLQAANEMAAAKVTISNAVFMFLLDFRFGQLPVIVGTLLSKSPSVFKTWNARAFPVPSR